MLDRKNENSCKLLIKVFFFYPIVVLSGISVLKQVYKIHGIFKQQIFQIHTWMGSAFFMGIFNIYKLGHLAIIIYPRIEKGGEDAKEILIGIVVFIGLIFSLFVCSIFIAKKAIKELEEQVRQIIPA